MSELKILLDPGHGGSDPGAVGPGGLRESNVVLEVCREMLRLLGSYPGINASLTRSDDTFVSLSRRAAIANTLGADFFISVHANSASTPARGFEGFTTPGQTEADTLAQYLLKDYGAEIQEIGLRSDLTDGDWDKEAYFKVLRLTRMPAVLFELDFIHTPAGEAFLGDGAVRDRMAKGLVSGLVRYLAEERRLSFMEGPPLPAPECPAQGELAQRVDAIQEELDNLKRLIADG